VRAAGNLLRGNGWQAIFFGDEDRYRPYLLLQEGVERFAHRIHGFLRHNQSPLPGGAQQF
jgi:hypothetical protein